MSFESLNDKQREACFTIDGPLLILAGAGSGKTQTMTHRIAYLVDQGVSMYNILAVTFTNKAANEMRERVEKLVGECKGCWITTFHSMCLRILREHAEILGYRRGFSVYDTVDTKTIIKNIYKELGIEQKELPIASVQNAISKAKEQNLDYIAWSARHFLQRDKLIAEVYKRYQETLMKNNAMDFDDLLLNCYRLFAKSPDVLDYYRHKFRYIMVDEYQDTNYLQYEIVKALSEVHQNICVVGDDDQCIYEWRGADIANILSFEEDFPNAKVVKLEQNYRSYGNILDAAYSVIKNNKSRKEKRLWTNKEAGEKITFIKAGDDKEEARAIVYQIKLLEDKYKYSDIAVLYRMNAQSRVIEDALRKNSIPYQILSGTSFYERKETKDMMSYMRLVVNPADDISFERVINEPKRGLGKTTLDKIKVIANDSGRSLFETVADPMVSAGLTQKTRVAVDEFVKLIEAIRVDKDEATISSIYDNLLVNTGYMKALEEEKTDEADARIENLLDFKSFIVDYEKERQDNDEKPTLEDFLERVTLASDQDGYEDDVEKVTLMTLHSAKGLEFPVVFMPGMEDSIFPSSRAIVEGNIEEERRLCYVGITRAKEKLFMTKADYRVLYGSGSNTIDSRFLKEMDPKVMTGDAVYREGGRTKNYLGADTGSLDGFAKQSINIFDPLKFAKEEAEKNATKFKDNIGMGDRVRHKKFGLGTIVEASGDTIRVRFDDSTAGTKLLSKSLAPIEKI